MVVATCAEAYARTEVSHKGGVDAPQRTLQRTDDGITVAYMFTGNVPSACNAGDGGCVWRIEGFGLRDAPGGYATPFRVDAFAVPEGCTAVVETVDSAFVDYDCRLAPARRIPEKGTAAEGVVKEGGQNASQGGFFPRNVAAAAGRVDVYRGREICNVVVNPVQYDAAANKARAYTKITYRVRFVPKSGARAMAGAPATKPVILPADNMLGNITMNVASAKAGDMAVKATGVAAGDDTRDYLIISVDKYAEAVDRFAEWKELLGFRVHKVLKGSWNSDAVKAEVEKAYAENPALYYLLIVGDHDDVPGQYMEHHADDGDFSVHYTDLYYGCMDGECDETPDIYRGRLSVSSPEEAATVVDKIIGYEKTPPTDAGFYERGVNCADYLDNDNGVADDYEDRRYVQTAEEIRALLPEGYELKPYYNQSAFVGDSIHSVLRTIYEGLFLALVVMVLFLRSWRSSLVVMLTIPVTVAFSILLCYLAGITINIMSLGAMAASVELIIDDAIVIIEQIYREHEEHPGTDRFTAVRRAIHDLFPAMVASSLATIVIHFPFRLMSGLAGSFFK